MSWEVDWIYVLFCPNVANKQGNVCKKCAKGMYISFQFAITNICGNDMCIFLTCLHVANDIKHLNDVLVTR